MRIKLLAVAAILGLAPLSAVQAGGLSYTFVDAGYVSVDLDDTDVDADGFSVSGSALVGERVYVFGGYSSTETDDFTIFGTRGSIEFNSIDAGLGLRTPLSDSVDFNVGVAFLWGEAKAQGGFSAAGDDDDTGYAVGAGLRALVLPQLELDGGVTYADIFDDDDTRFGVGALFHISKVFALRAGYSVGSDDKAWTAGGRIHFGG